MIIRMIIKLILKLYIISLLIIVFQYLNISDSICKEIITGSGVLTTSPCKKSTITSYGKLIAKDKAIKNWTIKVNSLFGRQYSNWEDAALKTATYLYHDSVKNSCSMRCTVKAEPKQHKQLKNSKMGKLPNSKKHGTKDNTQSTRNVTFGIAEQRSNYESKKFTGNNDFRFKQFDQPNKNPKYSPKDILYCIGSGINDNSSNLYSVSNYASSPSANNLCELNKIFFDIAINHITGIAYGISEKILYSINIETCEIFPIGNTNLDNYYALDFSQDGELFAVGNDDYSFIFLYTIDLETANTNGLMGFSSDSIGTPNNGDIAFDSNGILYLSTGDRLFSYDLVDNYVYDVGFFGISNIYGLDFSYDGVLYATQNNDSTGHSVLYTIDKETAFATKIGTIKNSIEYGNYGISFTDYPNLTDSDGDGMLDIWERQNHLNPNNFNDALDDFDDDGLINFFEYIYGTQIKNNDSDYDGVSDLIEIINKTDPNDSSSISLNDNDRDGMPNDWENQYGLNPDDFNDSIADPDNDGLANFIEFFIGGNPLIQSELTINKIERSNNRQGVFEEISINIAHKLHQWFSDKFAESPYHIKRNTLNKIPKGRISLDKDCKWKDNSGDEWNKETCFKSRYHQPENIRGIRCINDKFTQKKNIVVHMRLFKIAKAI